jgi:hypothetical protein
MCLFTVGHHQKCTQSNRKLSLAFNVDAMALDLSATLLLASSADKPRLRFLH